MVFFCYWNVPAQWIGLVGETEGGKGGSTKVEPRKILSNLLGATVCKSEVSLTEQVCLSAVCFRK